MLTAYDPFPGSSAFRALDQLLGRSGSTTGSIVCSMAGSMVGFFLGGMMGIIPPDARNRFATFVKGKRMFYRVTVTVPAPLLGRGCHLTEYF